MFNVVLSEQQLNNLSSILNNHLTETGKAGRGNQAALAVAPIIDAMQNATKIEPPKES